jgi:hypothetical protein
MEVLPFRRAGYVIFEFKLLIFHVKYIQVPLYLILIEIVIVCILRIARAVITIKQYKTKTEECYKPPILDLSYYEGGPEYKEVGFCDCFNLLNHFQSPKPTETRSATPNVSHIPQSVK